MIPSYMLTCCVSFSSNLTYIPFLEFALKNLLSWFIHTLVELLKLITAVSDIQTCSMLLSSNIWSVLFKSADKFLLEF